MDCEHKNQVGVILKQGEIESFKFPDGKEYKCVLHPPAEYKLTKCEDCGKILKAAPITLTPA